MRKKPILMYLLTILVLLSLVSWHFIIGPSRDYPGSFYNKNQNAIWIRHAWVDTEYSWETISELVHNLERHGITYVYVHSGPIEPDGTVPEYRYVFAKSFLDKAHAINSKMRFYSWLGQKRSKVDLDDEKVRQNIAKLSRKMVYDIGFDGIHFDFESIDEHDQGFVNLVREVNEAIPDRPISVALEEYIPPYMLWFYSLFSEVKDAISGQLLKDINPYVDHIVIMTHDTKSKEPWLYSWLIKQEVIAITRFLPEGRFLIGVPTYDDQRPSFDSYAENMTTGLQGVIDGLNSTRSVKESFVGVAIYANWETDESEWQTYRELWMGNKTN